MRQIHSNGSSFRDNLAISCGFYLGLEKRFKNSKLKSHLHHTNQGKNKVRKKQNKTTEIHRGLQKPEGDGRVLPLPSDACPALRETWVGDGTWKTRKWKIQKHNSSRQHLLYYWSVSIQILTISVKKRLNYMQRTLLRKQGSLNIF